MLSLDKLETPKPSQGTTIKGAVSTMLQRLLQGQQRRSEQSYTLSEVSVHCHCNDCWIVVCDHVYDVTTFLDQHPGGLDVLMEHAGRDATVAFFGSGHHPSTIELLEPFCVGTLAQHERVNLVGSIGTSGRDRSMWPVERTKVAVAD